MNTKFLSVLLITANLCFIADAFSPSTSVYADLNGSDHNSGLTPDAPVLSITKALAVAAKFPRAKTIYLGTGVFRVTNSLLALTNILITGVGQGYFDTNEAVPPASTNSTIIAIDAKSAVLLGDHSSLQNLTIWQTQPGYFPIEAIGEQSGMFTNPFAGRSTYQCLLKNVNCYGALIYTMMFLSTNTMDIEMDDVNVCSQERGGSDLIFGYIPGTLSPNLSPSNRLVLKNCSFSTGTETCCDESLIRITSPCYFNFSGGSVRLFGTNSTAVDNLFQFEGSNIVADLSPNLLVGDPHRKDVMIEPGSTNVIVNIHNLSASPTNCIDSGDPATCAIRWNGYEALLSLPH